MSETPADRLKRARERRFPTAKAAARAYGWKYPTYASHETGTRALMPDQAERYAKRLGVTAAWLLTGTGGSRPMIPIKGYIQGGGEVVSASVGPDQSSQIEAPPGADDGWSGLIVQTDSMVPAYRAGDRVIYETPGDAADHIGRECVVELPGGRRYLKQVLPGSTPGRYTLISYNAAPMIDEIVIWAARVRWVERA